MNTLRLTYRPDGEWHGELFGVVNSEGFSGNGSAWFGIKQLRNFCALLGSFPIADEGPSLAGGFWDNDGSTLKQCHLGVSLAAHDRRGSIQVVVTLAAPIWESSASDAHQSVTARFLAGYMDIERFRTTFEAMLDGHAEDAVLEATST